MTLRSKRLFLFDFDGVLATGILEWEEEILGGYRIFSELRRRGLDYAILGSGSNWSTYEIWSYLRGMGFMLEVNQVWIAARVAAYYLKSMLGSSRCLVVGEEGLVKELKSNGHKVVKNWRGADALVVGHDRFLSFKKLTNALRAINNPDTHFIAVNKVRWYYSARSGPILSPGAIVAMLEFQSGREATVVGKPSLIHFKTVMDFFGRGPEETVMIGDSIDADIKPAKELGLSTVLVSSVERWERRRGDMNADLVVNHVDDLVNYL